MMCKTKIALVIALVLIAKGASAQTWIQVSQGGGTTFYFDQSTLLLSQGLLLVKLMASDDKPYIPISKRHSKTPWASRLWNVDIDCKNSKFNLLDVRVFSEKMAAGQVVNSNKMNYGWEKINPSDDNQHIHSIAKKLCNMYVR